MGEDYKACYQAWNAKAKLNPEYVDDASFNAYYNEIRDASSKRNATIKAEEEAKKKAEEEEKKKAEEEAKKKAAEEKPEENPEGELILEGEEEPKKKEHEKGEIDVFPELDNLRNAGIAFENKIQLAL